MQSYSSDVTRYLMAASEGLIPPFPSVVREKKYTMAMFQSDMHQRDLMHYSPDSRRSTWYGDREFKFSCSWDFKEEITNIAKSGKKERLEEISPTILYRTCKQLSRELGLSQERVYDMWNDGIQLDCGPEEEEAISVHIASLGGDKETQKVFSKTVLLMRAITTIVQPEGEQESERNSLPVKRAVEKYRSQFTNKTTMENISKKGWSGPKSMFMVDCYQAQLAGANEAETVVLRAKERILMQLKGVGGFIVKNGGRKFEISSRGDGSTGLYYREFVIAESFSKSEETTAGVSVSATASFGPDFGFSVTMEASYSKMFGWEVTTEENPTEWKRIKEKTFLDGLSNEEATLGRLILFMNWYVGGLSEWYYTPNQEQYGSVMQETPIELELTEYIDAIKIDSYFRYGDLVAASDGKSMARESICRNHTFVSEADGALLYKKTGKKYKKAKFSFDNAKAVCNLSDDLRDKEVR